MKNLLKWLHNRKRLLRLGILCSAFMVLLFFCLSYIDFSRFHSFSKELLQMEKVMHKRLGQLEEAAVKALDLPKNEWLTDYKLDDDQILYKYYRDSLCSWTNTLLIERDDIFLYGNRLFAAMFDNPRTASQYPLMYVDETEQYMNLGGGWYVVRFYHKPPHTVMTALLVQTDYPLENKYIKSEINENLCLNSYFDVVPISYDDGMPIFGRNGGALFSVLTDVQMYNAYSASAFRWLSILFGIVGIFCFLRAYPGYKSMWGVLFMLCLLRAGCLWMEGAMAGTAVPFSSQLYSDPGFSIHFARLLINNIFIFLATLVIFLSRRALSRTFLRWRARHPQRLSRLWLSLVLSLLPLLLGAYIHLMFRSVINHSNVVMEIYKLDSLSIYSILIYVSLAFLFLGLYFMLSMIWPVWRRRRSGFRMYKPRTMVLYISLAALYSLLVVAFYGGRKEFDRNRIWTQKMSVDNDPLAEVFLKNSETGIATDHVLALALQMDAPIEHILSRLLDQHLLGLAGRYDIQVTRCAPGDNLQIDRDPTPRNCFNFFHQSIMRYGSPLVEGSNIYHLRSGNGRISYIGVFSYSYVGGYADLYIEMNAKSIKETIGYPELLNDQNSAVPLQLPKGYSFARYVRGNLNVSSGAYIYPTRFAPKDGNFYILRERGYTHYINVFDEYTTTILSHPTRTVFLYLVSFSYMALFFGVLMFAATKLPTGIWRRKIPSRSFRRKITMLIVISLVVALFSMGVGSIWFGIQLYNDNGRSEMEEKMQTAQATLEYYFRSLDDIRNIAVFNREFYEQLEQLSKNVHIDINIYSRSGVLVHTSQIGIFEKHLMGTRMNGDAFEALSRDNRLKFFHKEHVGKLKYNSVYAPLFNDKDELVAYVNLPYFSRQSDLTAGLSSIIATVVNVYILLLLAALLAGAAISNQLARPLDEVGKKMQRLDLTKKLEHIDYDGKDELGELIQNYNKMVDDVGAASQRMAQTEREQAWREMARQIAHEIKNPLTPMRLSLQHLMRLKKEGVPDWPDRFDGLARTLIEQIDILSDAASEFSSFSRFYSEEPQPLELNRLIREQCTLFSASGTDKLWFESDLETVMLNGRKNQLSRVLVNLISNAHQALEGQEKGLIRLRLTQEGAYYLISVDDNGPGVPEALRKRLFTPNFTTKSSGTGLGLAICRSIIEQSQGSISYGSSEWGGASFQIRLPIT
jgi:Signal transduction histidine kinase involved in nitrogen fixation and metabolism regulation